MPFSTTSRQTTHDESEEYFMDNNSTTWTNLIADAIIKNIANDIVPVTKSNATNNLGLSEKKQVKLNAVPLVKY